MKVECRGSDSPVWRLRMAPRPGGELVLSAPGLDELGQWLSRAEQDPHCRLVALEGAGGVFCRGMDLSAWSADPATHSATEATSRFVTALGALRGSSKLVVALVDGEALAGGVGLVAAADLVFATEASSFGLPEAVLGLVPAMVLPLLLERMAPQKARALALNATRVTASEALKLGLVDEVVADAPALEKALRTTARSALRLCPGSVARVKRLTGRLSGVSWRDGLELGARETAELMSDPAVLRVVSAYLAGESPPWFDRYPRPKGDS